MQYPSRLDAFDAVVATLFPAWDSTIAAILGVLVVIVGALFIMIWLMLQQERGLVHHRRMQVRALLSDLQPRTFPEIRQALVGMTKAPGLPTAMAELEREGRILRVPVRRDGRNVDGFRLRRIDERDGEGAA